MRLRVKPAAGGAGPLRLELPADCSLAAAQAAVCQALALPLDTTGAVVLGLNKRDALEGGPDTLLRELGVTNGDLLWLLSPAPPPAGDDPPAAAEPEAKRPRDADPPTQQQQQQDEKQDQQQEQQQAAKGKQPAAPASEASEGHEQMVGEEGMPPGHEEEAHQHQEPLPPSQRLPAYLLRTLQQSCGKHSSAADVLLLAAHAAMLETGFVPDWAAAGGGSGNADAAAGSSGNGGSALVPSACWVSASVCRVPYHLAPSGGDSGDGAAMEVEGEQQGAAGPACTLQCSSLGGGHVVLAAATQRHTRHVALNASAFLQPLPEAGAAPAGEPGAGGDEGAGPSDSRATAVWQLPDGGVALALGGTRLQLRPEAAKALWTRLKDGLAFPMLLAAYAEAGLQPPAGLLALPEDLKQRVLEALGAHDLAAVSCACSELRHLASQDALWRPLFEKEFPASGSFYATQARTRGYKWAFGQCWRERQQREEALRRARARTFMPAVPRFGVPRPPYYPVPPPPGHHPYIIGGDYDRFPQFGPNGGGLPGQFGGVRFGGSGGAGPSGAFLGGSRRQGGRGSSGGYRMY